MGSWIGWASAGAASASISAVARTRRATRSLCPPLRLALLREGLHALVEVVGAEAGLAQLHQLALGVRVQRALGGEQLADHPLVPALGERRERGDLRRVPDRPLGQLVGGHDLADQAPGLRLLGADGARGEEQLA